MISHEELLGRVSEILPAVSASADADDANGELSVDIVNQFRDAGVFRTIAPKVYGGLELGFRTFADILMKISAVSPSAGWTTCFLMGAAWRNLLFPHDGQVEMFEGRGYILGAGTAQPISEVEKVDGGYIVSGRTPWCSGSAHADWFTMVGLYKPKDAAPKTVMFAFPRSEVTIHDTWHILGMRSTSSRDISVENVFVPDHRAAEFQPGLDGTSPGHLLHANPMYHIPFMAFAMTEGLPVIVGMHRGAADAFADRARTRVGTISGAKAAERVPMQIRLGQAQMRATMAEQMVDTMIARNMAFRPDANDPKSRVEVKLHAAMATAFCLDSVNDMARSIGADGFRNEAPFQRFFRDINTLSRHAFMDAETGAETYGKMLLGLPYADPLV